MNSLTVNREFHCEEPSKLPYIQSSGVQSRKPSAETCCKHSWLCQQGLYHKRSLGQEKIASQTASSTPYCDHELLKRTCSFRNTTWANSEVAVKQGS